MKIHTDEKENYKKDIELKDKFIKESLEKIADIEANMGMVIEGVSTTKVAYELAQMLKIDMPIVNAIYHVIYEGAEIKDSIIQLMRREGRPENEYIIEIKGKN